MGKQYEWFSHAGLYAKCGNFTRTYEKVMPRGSHMRIGHFAVVVSADDVIAARTYEQHLLDDPMCKITRESKFWEWHKRDRLKQCGDVAAKLRPEHSMYREIMADIEREREHLK